MRWQKKLTKKELKHCRAWAGTTLKALQNTANHQANIEQRYSTADFNYYCCWECRTIFGKLGITGVLTTDKTIQSGDESNYK